MQDRIDAANNLISGSSKLVTCPVLVDLMSDEAQMKYAALPERLYIVKNGKIAYEGLQGPEGYNLNDMVEELKKII